MLKLAGYADRLSVRPGETINFKLSNATGAPVSAELVRVICADPNPAGPGIREEALAVDLADLSVAAHPVPTGSYATVDLGDSLSGLTDFTLLLTLQPTRLPDETAAIVTIDGADGGLALTIDSAGRLEARLGNASTVSAPLIVKQWVDVAVTLDEVSNRLSLACRAVGPAHGWQTVTAEGASGLAPPSPATLTLSGAGPALDRPTFDGRIESPELYARVLSADACDAARAPNADPIDPVFAFDLRVKPPRAASSIPGRMPSPATSSTIRPAPCAAAAGPATKCAGATRPANTPPSISTPTT